MLEQLNEGRMKWVGYVLQVEKKLDAYKIQIGEPEESGHKHVGYGGV
jgi:hypothetical protein